MSATVSLGLALALAQPARAEDGKPEEAPAAPLAWAKLSEQQKEAAAKLGVPVALTNSFGMHFVLVPPGEFTMGSSEPAADVRAKCIGLTPNPEWAEDEHPRHKVRLTRAFYMSIHEVTGHQLHALVPSEDKQKLGRRDNTDRPARTVSWDEATAFCGELGRREGRTYRLPTEAEWEYACRAGTTTPFAFGETISPKQANYNWRFIYGNGVTEEKKEGGPTPVGSFLPNPWGLYDVHGNAWEWCADWYGKYADSAQTDPKGPAKGTERVVRGGSWLNSPGVCRSAKRSSYISSDPPENVGFRVVIEAKQP